jgi:hypothetical protein
MSVLKSPNISSQEKNESYAKGSNVNNLNKNEVLITFSFFKVTSHSFQSKSFIASKIQYKLLQGFIGFLTFMGMLTFKKQRLKISEGENQIIAKENQIEEDKLYPENKAEVSKLMYRMSLLSDIIENGFDDTISSLPWEEKKYLEQFRNAQKGDIKKEISRIEKSIYSSNVFS